MTAINAPEPVKLKKKDFDAGIDVRWCPGCGDYSILANIQKFLPTLGRAKEEFAFISGIGCSSRFPYYMNTYGFHSIHGRAPAFATGLKSYRPDLSVWVVTGDGDGFSIGGNHLLHAMRRNVDLNILLFNNRIYGLTKGQYSPTSEVGKVTSSTPMGSIDSPLRPLSVVLGAEATFVARVTDTDAKLMQSILKQAYDHKGTSFIEIYQNCNVFNDGAFVNLTKGDVKRDAQLILEEGKPMIFGKERNKGLIFQDGKPAVATIGENGVSEDDIIVHNPADPDPTLAFRLARMDPPDFPVAMGILRKVERPTYDDAITQQVIDAKKASPDKTIHDLLHSGDTWEVK
jgi:2-oxoglutarate ferredoxin oxidoreductase subunit beta